MAPARSAVVFTSETSHANPHGRPGIRRRLRLMDSGLRLRLRAAPICINVLHLNDESD